MADNQVNITITADVEEAKAELSLLKAQLKEAVDAMMSSQKRWNESSATMNDAQKASWNAVNQNIQASIDRIKGNINTVSQKLDEVKGKNLLTGQLTTSLTSLGNMIKTAFVYDLAVQAINKIEDALMELGKSTLEVEADFEQLRIGIAGQLSAHAQYSNAGVKSKDATENFNLALIRADDIFNKLRVSSAQTGIPLDQLAKGFMGSVAPATEMGMSMDKLADFTAKMGAVAKATSIPIQYLGREIRDMLIGQRSQLTLEMGVTEEWIKQHKAAGDLAQAYMDLADKYTPMVKAQANTWNGIKAAIITSIQTIQAQAGQDIFRKLKEEGVSIEKDLKDNMGNIATTIRVALAKAFDYIRSLYTSIKVIVQDLSPIFGFLGEVVAKTLSFIKDFFALLAIAITTVKEGIEATYDVMKMIFNDIVIMVTSLGKAIKSALSGDLTGVKDAWKDYNTQVTANHKEALKEIETDTKKNLDKIAEVIKAYKDKTPVVVTKNKTDLSDIGEEPEKKKENNLKLNKELLAQDREKALGELEIYKAQIQAKYDLGKISKADELAQLKALTDAKLVIDTDYYEKLKGLKGQNKEDIAKADTDILKAKQKHAVDVINLDKEATLEANKYWKQLASSIESSLASSFSYMLTQATSFADGIKNIFDGILKSVIDIIAQITAKWLVLNTISMATGGGIIPISAVLSMKSAAGGFDIPSGVNPVTQLHQEEMVLPASIANPLRASLNDGGGFGGSTHITIHAVDAKSIKDLFMSNSDTLVNALKKGTRSMT